MRQQLDHDEVSAVVPATPAAVFAVLSDVTRMPELTPFLLRCTWLDGATHAVVGARFRSVNTVGRGPTWRNQSVFTTVEPDRELAWQRTEPFAGTLEWRYRLEPVTDGTRVTESYTVLDPVTLVGWFIIGTLAGVEDDGALLRSGMEQTLRRLAEVVSEPASTEPATDSAGAAGRSRPHVHDMVLVHRMFRREIALLRDLVASVGQGDAGRARVLAHHLDAVLHALHLHHTGEDDLLWPRLLDRVTLEKDLVHRMETQHEQVADAVAAVHELVPAWRAHPDPTTSQLLSQRLGILHSRLLTHLDEEEREVLPLVEQYVTVQEWAELPKHSIAGTPRSRLMLEAGAILEDTDAEERRHFLSAVPLPVRMLYRLHGARRYRRYVAQVRGGRTPAPGPRG